MKQLTIHETAAYLLSHNNYLILTHVRPDGDTIGSAAALCLGLRSLGKQAHILQNVQITSRYSSYVTSLQRPQAAPGQTIVSVDIASESLLPDLAADLTGKTDLLIDHHSSNTGYARQGLVMSEFAACGEIIYEILAAMGCTITKQMAEAIYVAVSTDTGCFAYSNVTEHTFLVAAACRRLGAETYPINKRLFGTKKLGRLKLEAHLTETASFYAGGRVCICAIPQSVQTALALDEDDLDGVSGFARDIEGVEIGILLRELKNGDGKISVRTGLQANASHICRHIGGGGHAGAAGATVAGGIEAAQKAILQALQQEGICL